MDRIEMCYKALDEMAKDILHNQIPLVIEEEDPNRQGYNCSWPETFLAYKKSVMEKEQQWNKEPLTPLQWHFMEMYMVSQYGFKLIANRNEKGDGMS